MTSALIPFAGGLVLAAAHDIHSRRIPNALSGLFLCIGLFARGALAGGDGLADGICGVVVGLFVLLIPYSMGMFGGGDIKLLAAIGAWVGPVYVLAIAALGCIVGALLAVAMTVLEPGLRDDVKNTLLIAFYTKHLPRDLRSARPARLTVPFGAALAIAAVALALTVGGLPHA
jgi:prepilin peptidase CpaA